MKASKGEEEKASYLRFSQKPQSSLLPGQGCHVHLEMHTVEKGPGSEWQRSRGGEQMEVHAGNPWCASTPPSGILEKITDEEVTQRRCEEEENPGRGETSLTLEICVWVGWLREALQN